MTAKQHNQCWVLLLTSVGALYYLANKYYSLMWDFHFLPNLGMVHASVMKFALINLGTILLLYVALKNYGILFLHALHTHPLKTPSPLQNLPPKPKPFWFDIFFISAIIIAYHAFFWNKFIPVQEGWFNLYA
jgi:hypothetical protein